MMRPVFSQHIVVVASFYLKVTQWQSNGGAPPISAWNDSRERQHHPTNFSWPSPRVTSPMVITKTAHSPVQKAEENAVESLSTSPNQLPLFPWADTSFSTNFIHLCGVICIPLCWLKNINKPIGMIWYHRCCPWTAIWGLGLDSLSERERQRVLQVIGHPIWPYDLDLKCSWWTIPVIIMV